MSITPTKRKRFRDEDVLIAFDKCCKTINNPESWVVERSSVCDEDVWLLLADGKVLATSHAKQRSLVLKRRHPKKVFCGLRMSTRGSRDSDICTFDNGRVDIGYRDNQRGEVALLHDMLEQMMGNESKNPGRTRQGKLLRTTPVKTRSNSGSNGGVQESIKSQIFERHLGKRASLRRRFEDKLTTACYHWQHNIASKAFNSWKFCLQQRKLDKDEDDGRRIVQLGLRNLGNTCYLNAVLQALFSVSAFAEAFATLDNELEIVENDDKNQDGKSNERKQEEDNVNTSWRLRRKEMLAMSLDNTAYDEKVGKQSLSREFRELSRMISSHKQVRYTPDGILRLVWRLFGNFRGFKQHDAAEIMAHLIDRLEVEGKEVVQELFGCQLCQRIEWVSKVKKDKGANKQSSTLIPFCGPWSVEIPPQCRQVGRQRKESLTCSIYDCINEATMATTINDYELSNKTRIDHATKQILFDSLPQILVLHINRTAWGENAISQKVHTKVEFPLNLSLARYRGGDDDDSKSNKTHYELCSIVCHHGNQMSSGHFTAYGRRQSNDWHHFNDARVTPVKVEDALQVQPYILIYELIYD